MSGGDRTTYSKTVNHEKHGPDFFYALLVVRRNPGGDPRCEVKHYFFRRDDDAVYEIPSSHVHVVDTPVVWPRNTKSATLLPGFQQQLDQPSPPSLERIKDQECFSDFYPNLKALLSKNIGALYWKGSLALVDGSLAEVFAIENLADGAPYYSITTASKNSSPCRCVGYRTRNKGSVARHAVHHLEKDLNEAIYRGKKG